MRKVKGYKATSKASLERSLRATGKRGVKVKTVRRSTPTKVGVYDFTYR